MEFSNPWHQRQAGPSGIARLALVVAGGVLGRGWRALTVVGLVQLAGGSLDTSQFNVLIGQLPSGKAVRTA